MRFSIAGYQSWPAKLFTALDGPLKPGTNPLADHTPLELRKCPCDLKHKSPGWGGSVYRLLVDVEVNRACLQCLDRAQEVDQGASKSVDRPGHDYIESSPLGVVQHLVQSWPRFPALGAANSGIMVLVDNFPAFQRLRLRW